LQLGAVNYAGNLSGLQVGVVNYAAMAEAGVQIGLVNLIPSNGSATCRMNWPPV
jgi:hypothetical protein